MFAKGFIGYEENLALGLVTCLSYGYLNNRLICARKHANEDYSELKRLFQLFERNIDKEKKAHIISEFIRK